MFLCVLQAMASTNNTPSWTISRSPKFLDKLLISMADMRKSETLTDFSIRISDVRIPCHMVVLAAASPYFASLFKTNDEVIDEEEVKLHILDGEIMKQIVDYMYTGEMVLKWNHVKDIIEICEVLQLGELKEQCEQFIETHLAPDNCIGWYQQADKLKINNTKLAAKRMIATMFRKVYNCEEFKQFSHEEVIDLIESEEVGDLYSDCKLDAVIGWVMSDKDTRVCHFESIVSHINLNKCSVSFLKYVFDNYESDLLISVKLYRDFTKAALRNQSPRTVVNADPSIAIICGDGKKECWKLDKDNKWTNFTAIPDKLTGTTFSICRIPNGFAIFGGGTDQCHLYDERTDEWNQSGPLSSKVRSSGSACIHDSVFSVGGFDDRCDKLECLNLQSLKWQMCPKMIQKDNAPIVASSKNLIFAIFNTCPINREYRPRGGIPVQCYDQAQNSWSLKAPLPDIVTNTWKASAVGVGENIFAVGGDQMICLRYNMPHNDWTLCPNNNLSTSHTFGSAVALGDKIYLTGGQNTNDEIETDSIDVYDIVSKTWENSNLKLPRKMKYQKAVCM